MAHILLERLVRAVPREFITRLMERQRSIYQQSIVISQNESWTDVEAKNVMPYNRRSLMESEFRKTAIACSLKAFDMPHAGENCSCVMVKADGLILTEHYVDGPGQLVRDAKSREQNSIVNKWLEEYVDQRLLIHPLPKLGRKPIYLNLLHGCSLTESDAGGLTVDDTSCFLNIAIPEEGSRKYLCNWSAQEILLAYATVPNAAISLQAVADQARPRAKAHVLKAKNKAAGNAE